MSEVKANRSAYDASLGMIHVYVNAASEMALERAARLLHNIPNGVNKAARSAIAKAAGRTRTGASENIRKQYDIPTPICGRRKTYRSGTATRTAFRRQLHSRGRKFLCTATAVRPRRSLYRI